MQRKEQTEVDPEIKLPKLILSQKQEDALDSLKNFISTPAKSVFILKGYAGTGKTTLLGYLIDWLKQDPELSKLYEPCLCATTGRAAKVLRDKTGYRASTVHSFIYSFRDLNQDLEKLANEQQHIQKPSTATQLSLMFDLKSPVVSFDGKPQPKQIIIIDEASMLSDAAGSGEHLARYGSGRLLTDLMTYAANYSKIIFVGDPCQLPPIEQGDSPSLDESYLKKTFNVGVEWIELTEIHRQKKTNPILQLSTRLRHRYHQPEPGPFASLPALGLPQINTVSNEEELIATYIETIKSKGYAEAIYITPSNATNAAVATVARKSLGFNSPLPMKGDLLQVVQNNYLVPLVNGDFVVIEEAGEPFYKQSFQLMPVKVRALHNKQTYDTLLMLTPLLKNQINLNSDENQRLFIDFYFRCKEVNIKQGTPAFNDAMAKDPYLNSLRATFGYAVTCHKSQGGEWPQVFLHMTTKVQGMGKPKIYQWWYTAVTRCTVKLHLMRAVFITPYQHFL